MPQVADGGYVSLQTGTVAPNSVYNSTTEPASGQRSVFDSMKRVFGNAIGNIDQDGHDGPLINGGGNGAIIASAR